MKVLNDISDVREFRKDSITQSLGFVPTMGALHEGHLSLIKKAKKENDLTIVSIFVNPAQFNNSKDLERYPRIPEKDLALLDTLGVDAVFLPSLECIYPDGFKTYVNVEALSEQLEGASRPGHFKGVCTVVTKLFNMVEADRAYFGQKDAQQLFMIKKMVTDLNINVEVIGCETCREPDGLAMSSRNLLLETEDRQGAPILYRSLTKGKEMIEQGEKKADVIISEMTAMIESEPRAKIDYIAVNDFNTLEAATRLSGEVLISLAVFFGAVRLIDNVVVTVAD